MPAKTGAARNSRTSPRLFGIYLGLGTVVERRYENDWMVKQSYIKLSGESTGDAGDQYIGLDRFGRVERQRWLDDANDPVDDFIYGYDRNGNRLWRTNELDHDFDELYHANGSSNGYDKLNQLTAFARGELNGGHDSITTNSRSQSWSADKLGNFTSVTTDSDTQTRTHDAQNRLNTIVVGSTTTTLDYDYNGNMIEDEVGNTFKYDAWNRLIKYNDAIHYRYDALGRRNRVTYDTANLIVRDLYYSASWQVIEERDVTNMAMTPQRMQYVWSPVYVDALVTRYRDIDGDLDYEEQLYALADANWNIMALVDVSSGDVVERYVYDPYGSFTVYEPDWSDTRTSSDFDWIYQHQGNRFDSATSLYHVRHRDYSPTLMRWVGQDPIQFHAGDSNLYRYVENGPVDATDPSGLQIRSDLIDWRRYIEEKNNQEPWYIEGLRKKWGCKGTSAGNCDRFVCDQPLKNPGWDNPEHNTRRPDVPPRNKIYSCEEWQQHLIEKRGYRTLNEDGSCPAGFKKAALYRRTDDNDFHVIKEMGDGTWCGKDKFSEVTCKDSSGKVIRDPASAHFTNQKYCGILCAPQG